MSLTASSLIHKLAIITRDFIHHTTQRFHLNREVFTITSQEYKSAPVALTTVSLSGQIRNRMQRWRVICPAFFSFVILRVEF